MSKTIREISYSVWEQISNFNITDDSPYPYEWIEDTVVATNASLMRQYYDARKLNDELLLTQANVPIEPVENDVTIQGLTIKAKYGFCKADVPPLLTGVENKLLSYVGPPDYSTSYTRRKIYELMNDKGITWKLPNPTYAVVGNQLYFKKSPKLGNVVSVTGYFRDPREVNTFDKETDPFPTPSEFKLEMLTLQQVMQSLNIPMDLLNDAQREYLRTGAGVSQPRSKKRSRRDEDDD